jgi:hypothetical protein
MSFEIMLLVVAAVLAAGGGFVYQRSRKRGQDAESAQRERENLDTVTAWPPEVTRLLTSSEREAHEVLVKALPECMIFSQVPLARFIRVPRRHSYAEWLTRVGHLSADFLICDRASLVIAAVALQTSQDSERAERRRARMGRVLKAAGVKVFVWRDHKIPSPDAARDQIVQRTGVPSAAGSAQPGAERAEPSARPAAPGTGKIPVPEVVAEVHADGPRLEPPSSTWFDDLDSGPTPLDPARKRTDGPH